MISSYLQIERAPFEPTSRPGFLQRQSASNATRALSTAIPHAVREVISSTGQPLDSATRDLMQSRFAHDFSQVRVHTDTRAAESARAMRARAYTVGSHIAFDANEFVPTTYRGRELLAHELTHTIQQRNASDAGPSSDPSNTFERNARDAGRAIADGATFSRSVPASGIGLQCAPAQDLRWKNDVKAARYRGRLMATRIRTHGLLSKEARAKINQELEYFEGEAKEAYLQLVGPVLKATVPTEMPEEHVVKTVPPPKITWSLVPPDPRKVSDEQVYASVNEAERKEEEEKKTGPEYAGAREYGAELGNLQKEWEAEPEHTEQESEDAGMRAYYLSTRQSQLESAGAVHAKQREQVPHMTVKEIYSQWESGKHDFVAVASSPVHTLKAEQLHQIWLRHWNDRFIHGEATRIRIAKQESAADFGAYFDKINRYHDGDRNAMGREFADAYEDEENARAMFRQSVFIMEYLRAADAQAKNLTLDEINKLALLQDKFTIKTEDYAIAAMAYADFMMAPGAAIVEESAGANLTFPRGTDITNRGAFQAPEVVTPSRPVSGFARPLAPKPAPVVLDPVPSTQMPPARVAQGGQPTYGVVKPAFEEALPPAPVKPSRPIGFRPPPKDIAEKPGLIEAETGPREYVKREYLGDVNPLGEQQSRYHVNIKLDDKGMMDADFVLRGGGKRSGALLGKQEFLEAKQHFELKNGAGSVKGAYGKWGGGDNLDTFNTRYNIAKGKGFSHEDAMTQAARKTKTGEWANAAGFKNVNVTKAEGTPGAFTNVEVEFTK